MLKRIIILLSLVASAMHAAGDEHLNEFVNDNANVLSASVRSALERTLRDEEARSGIEVVVFTTPSLDGITIEDFAEQAFNRWKIGKRGRDNGVLIVVAPNERKVRIEVGYGLESRLTDAGSSRIIRNDILPCFRTGDHSGGIMRGVERILSVLKSPDTQAADDVRSPLRIDDILPDTITGFINGSSILSSDMCDSLESRAAMLLRETSNSLYVFVLPEINNGVIRYNTLESVSDAIWSRWAGRRGVWSKRTVVMTIVTSPLSVHVYAGELLTDTMSAGNIEKDILKDIRNAKGDHDVAVSRAVSRIEQRLKKKNAAHVPQKRTDTAGTIGAVIVIVLVYLFLALCAFYAGIQHRAKIRAWLPFLPALIALGLLAYIVYGGSGVLRFIVPGLVPVVSVVGYIIARLGPSSWASDLGKYASRRKRGSGGTTSAPSGDTESQSVPDPSPGDTSDSGKSPGSGGTSGGGGASGTW